MAKKGKAGITIIKREEVIAGGHHGGAWKVAYADFVTAMMAFFLLMWLLNATTEAQKRGLADYFTPTIANTKGSSGAGQPFAGKSPFDDGPAISDRGSIVTMNQNKPPVDVEDDGSDTVALKTVHSDAADPTGDDAGGRQGKTGHQDGAAARAQAANAGAQDAAQARAAERAAFQQAAEAMRQTVAADPLLQPLAKQFSIDLTQQGLLIQIRDEDRKPMFATGSAEPNAQAQHLLQRLAPILAKLPEPVSIAGYTDGAPYSGTGMSNWDLSTERANATRRVLSGQGVPDARIKDVIGHADRDLLLPADPLNAANRRIAILLLRTAPHR
jgi:chemotaxis protein MotB